MRTRLMAPMFVMFAALVAGVAGCSNPAETPASHEHGAEAEEFERGPHRGRLLRSGDFAVEITIFETNVEPEFHVYAYQGDKPVNPAQVSLTVALTRLGGKVDRFTFKAQQDYLLGSGVVAEPHSFDVAVNASYGGKTHSWSYASYEGRTVIAEKAAREAGVTTEKTGPAVIKQTVELLGHVNLAPGAQASLRARFPGRVLAVLKNVGDAVASGEALARIESNESLQSYSITAPFAGVVLERAVNVGDVATDGVLFTVGDPSKLTAEFHVFDRDAAVVKAGQSVRVSSLDGKASAEAKIEFLSPVKDLVSQTIIARARVPGASTSFRAGSSVKGDVVVDEQTVPLAVKTVAIQRFRDFEVVYAKVGESYEVRMLEIGRRTPEWTEVLGGIDVGVEYVVGNSFLIKADIEKSGASHDH
jgi:cobalt-zinc-cadmium efflux system membrane fusion protein